MIGKQDQPFEEKSIIPFSVLQGLCILKRKSSRKKGMFLRQIENEIVDRETPWVYFDGLHKELHFLWIGKHIICRRGL